MVSSGRLFFGGLTFTKSSHPDIVQPDHPALSIKFSSDVRLALTRDGSYLDVIVENHLPCVSTTRLSIKFLSNFYEDPFS